MTFEERLVNPEALRALYGKVPDPIDVRIRSVNLNWRGPALTIRLDLPFFPKSAPQEWVDAEADRVQCHFRFLAVEELSLSGWAPPVVGGIDTGPVGADRRMRVTVDGGATSLVFDCAASVHVGHVSAFRIQEDGSDSGRHLFLSKLDARRHSRLPGTEEKTFYER